MRSSSATSLRGAVAVGAWPLIEPLVITGYSFTDAEVATVTLRDGPFAGRGEAAGVYYRDETAYTVAAEISLALSRGAAALDRAALAGRLPPGGARNALDCALWELEAQRRGEAVWRLAGLSAPRPLRTTYTIGVGPPSAMARRALALRDAKALKLKLNGDGEDALRIRAVRAARPEVWLGVDANQGFDLAGLSQLAATLADCDVRLVEQPLPVGREDELLDLGFPIPLCADESVQSSADLERLVGRFQVINIKLDKCGGLTEGLAMAARARSLGFQVMVGNMTCTSLGCAPAFLLAQVCDLADLDGPMFLRDDRTQAVRYQGGDIYCGPDVWGASAAA